MKKFALLAAVALYAAPASATIIVAGTPPPGAPTTPFVGSSGTLLASSSVPGSALTFSATFNSAVYLNASGFLDFYYQVVRTGTGTAPTGNDQPITSFTVSPFDSFLVDAQSLAGGFGPFVVSNNGADTSGVSRSLSGDVMTVNFGLNNLAGSDSSLVYIFRTNATNFASGTFGILDGSSMQGLTFAPTVALPEPSTWMTMLAGFGVCGLALRFRRRKTKAALA